MIKTEGFAKTVTLKLNFDSTHQYEIAVEVPHWLEHNNEACAMVGTNAAGKKFKIGNLSLPIMMLLQEFGHADSWSPRDDVDRCWSLYRSSKRTKWKVNANGTE